jgi:beta-RFAP synthase
MDERTTSVEVATASRLHFGMFSFGDERVRQYGGVGMMIDRPGLRLRFSPGDLFHACGPLQQRVEKFARSWAANANAGELPRCHIDVLSAPPEHSGLGVGTQLGLAVAAGLNAMYGRPRASSVELAALVERGRRSSVGIYGFDLGGLIVERGKLPGEAIAPLAAHCAVTSTWRVVLVQPRSAPGLSGGEEQQAFASVRPVPPATTDALQREVESQLLPALERRDFDGFAESVYRFGHTAGLCFAEVQGGPYNGPLLAEIVAAARRLGVAGVGQSSWGPTIFCLLRDEAAAAEFVARMRRDFSHFDANYTVARPVNHAATIATPGTTGSDAK